MNYLFRLFYCTVFIVLSGCAIQQQNIAKPKDVNQCLQLCEQRFDSCKQQCSDNCPRCSRIASDTAALDYMEYVHDKQVQGGYITRGLNSYRDPLQCRKVTCNCISDFLTCKQGCTGVIQKRLQAVPYCT
ncbi:acyltransferase [uncultured Legionella sp.]|uniref:acyltransferase n=1 Tax=uncultured Legionella sp. TaxID=210934 RepID=UPI0026174C3E|nr:acyltransferase [uncultured Legionella sp.]